MTLPNMDPNLFEKLKYEVKKRLLNPNADSMKISVNELLSSLKASDPASIRKAFPSSYTFKQALFDRKHRQWVFDATLHEIKIDEDLYYRVLRGITKRISSNDLILMQEPLHSILMDASMVQNMSTIVPKKSEIN
ncbi:MAG: hypothetical protein AAFQ94_29475 [Bacteroidota bacterium]